MTAQITYPPKTDGCYIVSDNANFSREVVKVAQSSKLSAGTVLGQITASSKYVALNLSASDGSQTAAAILWSGVDASSYDAPAVATVRETLVRQNELVLPDGINDTNTAIVIAQLKSCGIIPR